MPITPKIVENYRVSKKQQFLAQKWQIV